MRLKHMLRQLAATPLFSGMVVLMLAGGIGANTAIFSVINGVLLKPLPYPRSDELVAIDHAAPGFNLASAGAAPFQYFVYREEGRAFRDVALWTTGTVSVTGIAQPEEVRTLFATGGLLPILGVQPMLGRAFSTADDTPGGAETVILTAGYWRARFGGDRAAVGRIVMLDGRPREIVGVLPDGFWFLDRDVSLIVPMRLDRSKVFLGQFSYNALARLKPGATIEAANADATRLVPVSLTRFPPFPGATIATFQDARITPHVMSLKDDLVGDVATVLWVLMGTIAVVLLIACANVANLLLVRADARQQELAVRAALGAGAGRIVRELLAESLTLAAAGGVVGLGLALAGVRFLVWLAPGNLPRLQQIALDLPVLAFALAVTLLSGLLFGLVPALRQRGTELAATLRAGGRTASASRDRERARSMLVVAQVALSLVLLVSSGLMIRTFQALRDVDPGFTRPEEVQTLRLSIPNAQAKDEAVARVHQAILDRMAAVPGVSSVAIASTTTMSGQAWHDPVYAEDRTYGANEAPPIRMFKFVSPNYMRTWGGSVLAGRDFTWADIHERRPVAMVSVTLARELWGDPSRALGKRIRPYTKGDWREVVGVVSDTRDDGVTEKAPAIAYWPLSMVSFLPRDEKDNIFALRGASYVIRSSRTGTEGFVKELGEAVWAVNPNLPLASVRTLEEIYAASLARTSFTLVMLGIAGGMALLLGIAGIYAVISYSVAQRRREIGIRIALGAQPRAVTRLFVRHGLLLACIGVAIGLAGAFGVTRVMTTLLFGVSAVDPLTYVVVSGALVAATALACYVPASRASRIDPIGALRAD